MPNNAPQNPAGEYVSLGEYCPESKDQLIKEIAAAPMLVREAVEGLTDEQLDTKYRNWTLRQIVHHVADSHMNSLMRFKWTLAENLPTIKAYEEADWVRLPDSAAGDVEPALLLLAGLHAKWTQLLYSMTDENFAKCFVHPQTGDQVSLWEALNYYPWHAKHHSAQIRWVRNQNDW